MLQICGICIWPIAFNDSAVLMYEKIKPDPRASLVADNVT